MPQRHGFVVLAAAVLTCALLATQALAGSSPAGWAKLTTRTGPHGAIKRSFPASANRIVITARVTSVPSPAKGMKIELIRPDGRNAKTTRLQGVTAGQTFAITLAHSAFTGHPGRWRARFVVRNTTRSAITFNVKAAPRPTAKSTKRAGCDSSYPTVCIPSPPPDLDCGDIPYSDFTVRPPDRQGFDGNGDGIGCES